MIRCSCCITKGMTLARIRKVKSRKQQKFEETKNAHNTYEEDENNYDKRFGPDRRKLLIHVCKLRVYVRLEKGSKYKKKWI